MSEQKPENGFTSSKILNKELNDKVQNVKKSIVSTLFKIIIALAIIVFQFGLQIQNIYLVVLKF